MKKPINHIYAAVLFNSLHNLVKKVKKRLEEHIGYISPQK